MEYKKLKTLYFKELHYSESNLAIMNNFLELHYIDMFNQKLGAVKDIKVFFTSPNFILSKKIIERMPNLILVVSNTTGESHIDIDFCKKKKIKVISLINEQKFLQSITPTSEYTVGLMICLLRKIIPASHHVNLGNWSRWGFGSEKMLSRMTIGIIGLGRIGKKVANICNAFGMKVVYYDIEKKRTKYTYINTIESLALISDVISIHVPFNKETMNMLNDSFFQSIRAKQPYIINTARGEIICEKSLLIALKKGFISGAALDVLSSEFSENFKNSKERKELIKLSKKQSNLIITPHIAGSTKDAWHLTQERVVKKCFKYLKEKNEI